MDKYANKLGDELITYKKREGRVFWETKNFPYNLINVVVFSSFLSFLSSVFCGERLSNKWDLLSFHDSMIISH